MNNQNSQQNNHFMGMYARVKSLLRKLDRVCTPIIEGGSTQVDYFVVNDYDGLQLNSN